MKITKSVVFMPVLALLLALGAAGCGGKKAADGEADAKGGPAGKTENAAQTATPVRVAQAKTQTVTRSVPVTGSISALQTVNLSPKVTARVVSVAGREGQTVRAGQVIVQQDTSDLLIQLQQTQANAQAARAKLAQAKTNANLQVTTSSVGIQDAQQQVRSAEEQLSLAKRPQRSQEVSVAQNNVAQAQANYDRAQADRKRYESLVKEGAAAQITLDQYVTQEEVARAALASSKELLNVAQTGGRSEQVQTAQTTLARAQAALRLARANTQNNAVRQDDIRNTQALVAQADAQVAAVRQQISDASIVSPVDGVIAVRQTEPGQLAAPGTSVMQIVRLQNVYFEAQVPETDIASVAPGKPVSVTVDAYPGKAFAGRVGKVYPTASTSSRTFRVRIEVPNSSGRLRPGMFAQGSVAAEQRTGVVVPKDAVVSDGENEVVYVAQSDNTARKHNVEVGIQTDTTAEIRAGLSAGSTVIVAGQNGLRDGAAITVKKNDAPEQSASAQNAPAAQ